MLQGRRGRIGLRKISRLDHAMMKALTIRTRLQVKDAGIILITYVTPPPLASILSNNPLNRPLPPRIPPLHHLLHRQRPPHPPLLPNQRRFHPADPRLAIPLHRFDLVNRLALHIYHDIRISPYNATLGKIGDGVLVNGRGKGLKEIVGGEGLT